MRNIAQNAGAKLLNFLLFSKYFYFYLVQSLHFAPDLLCRVCKLSVLMFEFWPSVGCPSDIALNEHGCTILCRAIAVTHKDVLIVEGIG